MLLHPPTCVGFRYGQKGEQRWAFLGSASAGALWLDASARSFDDVTRVLAASPIALTLPGAGILNLLCIHYALRPRVSSRLTLGGRTWPRNPWVYGDQDSYLVYRYSCLHSHWPALHRRFPSGFTALVTLSYHDRAAHRTAIRSFGTGFDRQSFSARHRSMSQLLRTV